MRHENIKQRCSVTTKSISAEPQKEKREIVSGLTPLRPIRTRLVVLEVVCDSSDPCNLSQVLPRLGMFCFDCPPN